MAASHPDPAVRQSRREWQLRVSLRKADDEHMFSALPPIAARGESCQHLRSAPVADIVAIPAGRSGFE